MDFVTGRQDRPDFVCQLLDGWSWTELSWKAKKKKKKNAGEIYLNAEKR